MTSLSKSSRIHRSVQVTQPLPLPHLRFVQDRCITTRNLSTLSHTTTPLRHLQAADMTKYCKYQAELFKELVTIFKKNTPLDKLMQCVAVIGHKSIRGSHIFGPKVAQIVKTFFTFYEIRSLLPCFQTPLSLS
jgi:hypothetical protein